MRAIGAAALHAQRLPAMLTTNSEALTGPAASVAGIYQYFSGLVDHGWSHVNVAAGSLGSAPPAERAFLRENVGTYVIAVYDGHFDLSLIGKTVASAYQRLGGPDAFSRSLTKTEVEDLARAYSPEAVRLRPHPWQQLVNG